MTTTTPTRTTTPELIQVNPADLGVRDQARADATPDAELVASVKQYGIMQPPTITWDADQDRYVILMGHRRVGAAIQAGLTDITCIVGALTDEAVRLEQQIVENERRKALTPDELAKGYKKLELFGRTPAEIAQELGETPTRVKAALAVAAADEDTRGLIEEKQLNLEQAAIIAEFADNAKVAEQLADTAVRSPGNFAYQVERARKSRDGKLERARLTAEFKADGITIIKAGNESAYWWRGNDGNGRPLERLVDDAGERLGDAAHADCPGHAVIITGGDGYSDAKAAFVCTDAAGHEHIEKDQWDREHREVDPEEQALAERRERERDERIRAHQEQQARIEANTTARLAHIRGILGGRLNQTPGILDLIAESIAHQIQEGEWYHGGLAFHLLTGDPIDHTYEGEEMFAAEILSGRTGSLKVIAATAFAFFEGAANNAAPYAVKYFERLTTWGHELSEVDIELRDRAQANLDALAAMDAAEGDDVDGEV